MKRGKVDYVLVRMELLLSHINVGEGNWPLNHYISLPGEGRKRRKDGPLVQDLHSTDSSSLLFPSLYLYNPGCEIKWDWQINVYDDSSSVYYADSAKNFMLDSLFLASALSKMAADNSAKTTGELANTLAHQVRTQNEKTQHDVEKLFLITQALWELLKQQNGFTDEQLEEMITSIDLRDGKLDGKISTSAQPVKCPQCQRTIVKRQYKCLYCGCAVKQTTLKG